MGLNQDANLGLCVIARFAQRKIIVWHPSFDDLARRIAVKLERKQQLRNPGKTRQYLPAELIGDT